MNVCFKNTYITKKIDRVRLQDDDTLFVTFKGDEPLQFEYLEIRPDELDHINRVKLGLPVENEQTKSQAPDEIGSPSP